MSTNEISLNKHYSSFDLFSMRGINPVIEPNGNYVIVEDNDKEIRVMVYSGSNFVSQELFSKYGKGYIQEEKYQDEGKNLHRIIKYMNDSIVTIVLSKDGASYYLEEIKEEFKTDTAVIYISKFYNSDYKVKINETFLKSFDRIYHNYLKIKPEILWEYIYSFRKNYCHLYRKHKQLHGEEYEDFLSKEECFSAGINEYFWLDRNPMYKKIECP